MAARRSVRNALYLGTVLSLAAASGAAAEPPKVVASIKPVHSLVASVMQGVGEPELLVKGAASPHSYSLRPSEARALSQAKMVFWVGEGMESFLIEPLEALSGKAEVIELAGLPGIELLQAREGGAWEAHLHEDGDDHHGHGHDEHAHGEKDHGEHEAEGHADHDEHGHDEHAHDEHGHDDHGHDDHGHEEHGHKEHGHDDHGHAEQAGKNLHLWLDAHNAEVIVQAAVRALSQADPGNAERYQANGTATLARLEALEAELKATLEPVRDTPYIVFHDAYHYFEEHYGLNAVGSISVSEGRAPGAKRLYEIRKKLVESGARCVFAEPQFEPALVDTVIEGTSARKGVLDPLGAELTAGPGAYDALLRGLAASLKKCLSPTA